MSLVTDHCSYRILVITNLWPTEADPGYGSFVEAQMESLRPLGVAFDVLFINGRDPAGITCAPCASCAAKLKTDSYDLIHAHFGLSGWVARCQGKVPVVVSFMGDDVLGRFKRSGRITLYGRLLQASSYVLARLVAAVIVKSREMKSKLSLDSAHVIPNGVDLNLFRPLDSAEARRTLGLDPKKKFVLFPYNAGRRTETLRLDRGRGGARRARAFPSWKFFPSVAFPAHACRST